MRLRIQGGTKTHARHCRQFARFFCHKFFSKDINKQIDIKLDIVKKKKIGYNDNCAEVEWVDNPRQPRKFKVTIYIPPKVSLRYLISALAHEMVHVKQYVKNELIDLTSTDFEVSIYKNKKYNIQKVPYFEQPWEIEAYGRTYGLLREYLENVNLAKRLLKKPVDF